MPRWVLACPNCGTANEVSADQVVVDCGKASCTCVCINCSTVFSGETEYWRWLGLDGPPDEPRTAKRPG
jgi:uncharacterized Zn finger protein